MAESGYAPDLTSCGVCGEVIEPAGVLFRSGGHSRGRKVRGVSVVMHSLGQYPAGDASCADSRAEQGLCVRAQRTRQREQFCGMAEEYVKYHLGRGFESLQFYQSLQMPIK